MTGMLKYSKRTQKYVMGAVAQNMWKKKLLPKNRFFILMTPVIFMYKGMSVDEIIIRFIKIIIVSFWFNCTTIIFRYQNRAINVEPVLTYIGTVFYI